MASAQILKYPLKSPVDGNFIHGPDAPTGRIDYLKLRRFRVIHEKSEGGYGGSNLPGNRQEVSLDPGIVYLAMPQQVSVSYQTDYSQINMGTAGVFGAQIAGAITNGGGADAMTSALQSAAAAALPEFAYNKGASMTQNLANVLGLETGITGNAMQALTKGRIMNPFTEQVFNGVQFRNHQFTFKMFARNKKEAQNILRIIKYLKMGALPALGDASQEEMNRLQENIGSSAEEAVDSVSGEGGEEGENTEAKTTEPKTAAKTATVNVSGKFLKVPDRYLLEFVRFDANLGSITKLNHYKFHPCVCTNISVNYTPDGQYVSFKDGIMDLTNDTVKGTNQMYVPAVEIGIAFAETRFVTQSDILAGF